MNLYVLKETISNIYAGTNYPVFLLNENFEIESKPSNFFDVPNNFFIPKFIDMFKDNQRIDYRFEKTEYYLSFKCNIENIKYVVVGPILYPLAITETTLSQISFFKDLSLTNIIEEDIRKIPVYDFSSSSFALMLYNLINNEVLTKKELLSSLENNIDYEKLKKDVDSYKFNQREETQRKYSYQYEKDLFFYVKQGDSKSALIVAKKIAEGRTGNLSINMLTKTKYLLIASITLLTRVVIEAGVDIESAYSLSDLIIQKVDTCSLRSSLTSIYTNAIKDYCALVKNKQYKDYPLWVRECMDYIQRHLHEEISLEDISVIANRVPSYVSVQFKKVTGISIMTYITNLKMEEAKHLLANTDLSSLEISCALAYSSQGHFSSTFKNNIGATPSEYRRKHTFI